MDKLEQEITKELGDETQEALRDIKDAIDNSPDKSEYLEKIKKLEEDLMIDSADVKILLLEVVKVIKDNKIDMPKELDVWIKNHLPYPKEIKVSNLKDIKITKPEKFPDIKIPDKVSLKEIKELTGALEGVKKEINKKRNNDRVTIANRNERDAIPVVLTDRTRKKFYDAITTAFGSFNRFNTNDAGDIKVDLQALETVGNGQKTVASAGTAEVLATNTTIKSVTIKALLANTNNVYVGDSSVDSSNGFELDAGESISLDINNLADIYIDVDTNGEGVSYIYIV
jgi:hypothetical protein